MSTIDELGREVAGVLDAGPGRARLLQQRQRLIDAVAETDFEPVGRPRWVPVSALAVAAAAALVVVQTRDDWSTSAEAELTAESAPQTELYAGMWLHAPHDEAMPIELGNNGRVELAPGSRARVIEASDNKVRLVLEHGSIDADLREDAAKEWVIEAGPVRIGCVHAAFMLEWNAGQNQLAMDVASGDVAVDGGSLGESGLRIAAGGRVEVGARGAIVSRSNAAASVVAAPEPVVPEQETELASGQTDLVRADDTRTTKKRSRSSRRSKSGAGQPASESPPSSWRTLAIAGRDREALAAAQDAGFPALLAELGSDDLRVLANSARAARNSARAEQTLVALRNRFPKSRDGKLSAFLLGRVALELEGDSRKAAKWFRTYAEENPSGRFRQEADGRLVDALNKSGDRAGARTAAQAYLSRYGEGSTYGELARSLAEAD